MRGNLLSWFGIVGGAISLFSAAQDLLDLSDWVRWIVSNWRHLTHVILTWVFGWVGIRIPPELAPLLTFSFFAVALTIGVRLRSSPSYPDADGPAIGRSRIVPAILVTFLICGFLYFLSYSYIGMLSWMWGPASQFFLVGLGYLSPAFILIAFCESKIRSAQVILVMMIFTSILSFVPLHEWASHPFKYFSLMDLLNVDQSTLRSSDRAWFVLFISMLVYYGIVLLMLIVAPVQALGKRLTWLFMGLVALFVLDGIARLNLKPPAVKGE